MNGRTKHLDQGPEPPSVGSEADIEFQKTNIVKCRDLTGLLAGPDIERHTMH